MHKASLNLRDLVLNKVYVKIRDLIIEKITLISDIKSKYRSDDFNNITNFVSRKILKLTAAIKTHHQRKFERNNIIEYSNGRRNRKFREIWRAQHHSIRKQVWKRHQQCLIQEAKSKCPEQNVINLSSLEITDASKSLLEKGPSFVPSPVDIKWYKLKQDFDSFSNKL